MRKLGSTVGCFRQRARNAPHTVTVVAEFNTFIVSQVCNGSPFR